MYLFEDLLNEDDLAVAVSGIAREFRNAHELPEIYQLGLVVPDVEEAARSLEARGIAPFFIAAGSPAFWRERDEERQIKGKLGLVNHQGFEIELLEPADGTDFYGQSIDPQGGIVVQHLGFMVDDVDERAESLSASGSPLWIRGGLKLGPAITDFAYMDSVEEAGIIIEFISRRFFGWRVWPMNAVFRIVARIEKWTGKRSISV